MSIKVGLTDDDHAARRRTLGGSDAPTLVHGTPEMIERLWQEKRGITPPVSAADRELDASLPAMMGQWTEELNRRWFTRITGLAISDAGKRCVHPDMPWLSATLDGIVQSQPEALFEAKHVNPFDFSLRMILDRYMPQLQHSMFVAGLDQAVLSIFVGNTNWHHVWVDFDAFYHADLLKLERAFWDAVKSGENPVAWPISKSVSPAILDMTPSLHWCTLASRHRAAAAEIKSTTEQLRAMVPPDAREAHGGGVIVRRDKRGTPRIASDEEGR